MIFSGSAEEKLGWAFKMYDIDGYVYSVKLFGSFISTVSF